MGRFALKSGKSSGSRAPGSGAEHPFTPGRCWLCLLRHLFQKKFCFKKSAPASTPPAACTARTASYLFVSFLVRTSTTSTGTSNEVAELKLI